MVKAACFLIAILLFGSVYSQNISEISLKDQFNSIEVESVYKVMLSQGQEQKVRFESPDDLNGKVWAEVDGGILSFGSKGLDIKKITIYVQCTRLEKLEITGAAIVIGQNEISSDKLEIEATGASKLELQLNVKNLSTEISGASVVKLSGKTGYHRTEISGAANLKAYELETAKANVEVSGAAQATLNVTEELKGETSGIGKINLKQNPKVLNIEKSGVSKVYYESDSTASGTQIEMDNARVITIDENGVVIDNKAGGNEPLVIDDKGVRLVLNEKQEDGKMESRVLIINDDGVKIVTDENDTTGQKHFGKHGKKDKFHGHWNGLDLGVNGFLNLDNKMELPERYEFLDLKMEKSINVKVNLLQQDFAIVKRHLGIVTGLGLEYANYRFKNNVMLNPDTSVIWGGYDINPDKNYEKSKLVVNYLDLPLLLEYQTNAKSKLNSFHLAAGTVLGVKIGSHTKVVYDDGSRNKDKVRDSFYLNPFKCDLTVRAGWGILNLWANYSTTTLFKADKGPQLYPFSVGLTLGGF